MEATLYLGRENLPDNNEVPGRQPVHTEPTTSIMCTAQRSAWTSTNYTTKGDFGARNRKIAGVTTTTTTTTNRRLAHATERTHDIFTSVEHDAAPVEAPLIGPPGKRRRHAGRT